MDLLATGVRGGKKLFLLFLISTICNFLTLVKCYNYPLKLSIVAVNKTRLLNREALTYKYSNIEERQETYTANVYCLHTAYEAFTVTESSDDSKIM